MHKLPLKVLFVAKDGQGRKTTFGDVFPRIGTPALCCDLDVDFCAHAWLLFLKGRERASSKLKYLYF